MPSRCILILTRPQSAICDNLSKELNYLLIYNSKLENGGNTQMTLKDHYCVKYNIIKTLMSTRFSQQM